jgi:SAM-dependent methyltransferase
MSMLGTFVGEIGAATSAALVVIGDRLGFYKVLAAHGPTTPVELARRTETSERMVREWLLNQAAGGYVGFDAATGRFAMNEEQAAILADPESPVNMQGAFDVITSMHRDVDKLIGAFKTGKGVPWGEHDVCLFCGTERFFAGNYRGNLVSSWIPALEGVKAKLERGAEVADVGCGHGASTVLMGKAFPASKFIGFDAHGPSVECARTRAAAAGLKNVRFEAGNATDFPAGAGGGYDLVCIFDALHDMADPTGCAVRAKKVLKADGTLMVVEPNAADTVEGNLNPISRVFSAASTMICVPASMSGNGPALGACAGPKKLTEVLNAGGFPRVRVATSTPFNIVLEGRG